MGAMTATIDRLPFTGDDDADRAARHGPARAAHRLRARPAGHRPEGLLRAARAAAPARPSRRRQARRDRSGRARRRVPRRHRRSIASRAPWPARCSAGGRDRERLWERRIPDLDGGDGRPRPQAAPARPAGHRRDEGRGDPRDPRQAAWRGRCRDSTRVMPKHPTLGDVDSAEALASYQAGKRAKKAEQRAAKG